MGQDSIIREEYVDLLWFENNIMSDYSASQLACTDCFPKTIEALISRKYKH